MLPRFFSTTKKLINHDNVFSKIVFTILVIIIFYILLHVGFIIIEKFIIPRASPILIKNMIDGGGTRKISSNQRISNSIPIIRSVNKRDGIEFTWSVWVYLDPPGDAFAADAATAEKSHYIFFKGAKNSSQITDSGINNVNGPGVYVSGNYKQLEVHMDVYDSNPNIITIDDIPIRKWINIIVRCNQSVLDVFINGTLAQSRELSGIPQQNYNDVYVANFTGQLSLLRYFAYAIDLLTIEDIIKKGPNLVSDITDQYKESKPQYLSLQWFLNN